MSTGITTIISRITIPEKIADVQERAADTRQVYIASETQQKIEKDIKTVRNIEKSTRVEPVKKEKDGKGEQKNKKNKDAKSGTLLDLHA